MRVDLHIHTTASDGCWPPERVLAEAKSCSIGLFAIADHDTIANVSVAKALARKAGLAFLHGVEVSTHLNGHLFHVLAYGFDLEAPSLTRLLRENKTRGDQYNNNIVRSLIAAGYPLDFDEYAAYEYDRTRGGWQVFNFLMDQGICTSLRDYFDNLLPDLSVERTLFPHPAEAIAAIREAGGVPILAHPGESLRYTSVTEETLRPFLDFGIAGLECYSQYHKDATIRFCLDWCNHYDLLITGGSDCHGGFVGRKLGVPVVDVAALRLGVLAERIIR